MNGKLAALAYSQVGLETGVSGADPHRLILMLYDGALLALRHAEAHMHSRNVAAKGQSVSKAIQIIEEGLRLSLDRKVGGALAAQLDDLYAYMGRRLLLASAANDPAGLAEVSRLLASLREAWAAIVEPAKAAGGKSPDASRPLSAV